MNDDNSGFFDWWGHITGGKPMGEPWGADAKPTYNLYVVEYESTDLEQILDTSIMASAFTIDNERVAVFYGGYGDMVAVVYNILSVHVVPPRANI